MIGLSICLASTREGGLMCDAPVLDLPSQGVGSSYTRDKCVRK